jgi:hypothetical protein
MVELSSKLRIALQDQGDKALAFRESFFIDANSWQKRWLFTSFTARRRQPLQKSPLQKSPLITRHSAIKWDRRLMIDEGKYMKRVKHTPNSYPSAFCLLLTADY